MNRNTKLALLMASVVAVATLTSACEIDLPAVDCSGIDQPDMGGLVCLGLNAAALSAGVIGIIVALLVALGGPVA